MSDVAVDKVPFDGMVERRADHGVDLVNGLGCEPVSATPASALEVVIQLVEVVGAQSPKGDLAERGSDVAVDEPGVAVGGGRSELAALVREPRIGEELAEGDRPSRQYGYGVVCMVEALGELLGLRTVVADRVPASAFPSGERVEAVVGDDVDGPGVERCSSSASIDHFDTNPKIARQSHEATTGTRHESLLGLLPHHKVGLPPPNCQRRRSASSDS